MITARQLAEEYEGKWMNDNLGSPYGVVDAFLAGWAARGKADSEIVENESCRNDMRIKMRELDEQD